MEANDPHVSDALKKLRITVRDILEDGDDPAEVLALGTLVRRYAEEDTDLVQLRENLEHTSLSEVVGDAAFAINEHDDEDPDDEVDDDDDRELGDEEDDLLGED
jgi:hypothetical protein